MASSILRKIGTNKNFGEKALPEIWKSWETEILLTDGAITFPLPDIRVSCDPFVDCKADEKKPYTWEGAQMTLIASIIFLITAVVAQW